jgi:mannose-6-phosphate isomerase-like protein (cupin superfamily)
MLTRPLPEAPDVRSPAGAEIRYLMEGAAGNMIHSTVPPGQVNRATVHATVSEFWHVLSGRGEIWRRDEGGEEVTVLERGVSIDIPVGTAYQYPSSAIPAPVEVVGYVPYGEDTLAQNLDVYLPVDGDPVVVVTGSYSTVGTSRCPRRTLDRSSHVSSPTTTNCRFVGQDMDLVDAAAIGLLAHGTGRRHRHLRSVKPGLEHGLRAIGNPVHGC